MGMNTVLHTQVSIKILLLDDEYLALNLLEGYVQQLIDQGHRITLVGKIKHPLKAMEILHSTEVDIVFLDIQMPNLSGVNLLKTLHRKPVAVFTTAYDQYAAQAFDLDVADYLVKPIAFERFLQAYNKAVNTLHTLTTLNTRLQDPQSSTIEPLSQLNPPAATPTSLSITADGKLLKIPLADIVYCEGAREYVIIHTISGSIMTLERMKRIEELLPPKDFVRVHRSYIVSVARVKSLEGTMLNVGGQLIPVSREVRDEVIVRIFA
jgi:two-component system, LytTR family, response regulator LytT